MPEIPSFRGSFEEPAAKQGLVDAVFDIVSSKYDVGNDLLSLGMHHMWRDRLIKYARIESEHRVLDVACGTGDITWAVALLAREVVGTDNNKSMMRLAEPKRPAGVTNVQFVEADAAALPFEDQSFDRVLISFANRGLPDLQLVVAEAFRVLKPGGELWTLDFARPPYVVVDVAWRGTLYAWGAIVGTIMHWNPRTYMYIPASLAHYRGQRWLDQAMRNAGFETQLIETTFALMAYNRGTRPTVLAQA